MLNNKKPLIGIIGGNGKMGNWFKIFFEKQQLKVIISDKNTKLSNIDLAKKADIVIVSVPINIAVNVIEEIRDYMKKNSLLIDFTSVKIETVKAMEKAKCGTLGIHPLFGPLAVDLKNQNIIFCKHKNHKYALFLKKLFLKNNAKIIEISPEEHDLQMAFLQSLVHFSNIVFSYFLYTKKFQPLPSFFTPVFKLQSLVFGRILAQDSKLYADIGIKNPYFKKLLTEYIGEIIAFQKNIEQGDYKEFQKKFKQASSYLSNFVKIAEGKTTEILKTIEKQPIKIGNLKKLNVKKAKIGFLGPKGTFSWTAAKKIAPHNSSLKSFLTIRDIFEGVNNLEIDFGVVPIQNMIAGIVSETMHSFIDYPIYVLTSFKIPIHHHLLSREKEIKNIKIIKSHPQALSQCSIWLAKNLPKALKIPSSSTVSPISENKFSKKIGFIASKETAKIFKLNILAENIEDSKENFTKFFFIAREFNKDIFKKTNIEAKNTLLLLSVYDRPGVLRDILNIFAKRRINLAALHSIPSHFHPWDYLFFLEIESLDIKNTLKELDKYCLFTRIIGTS